MFDSKLKLLALIFLLPISLMAQPSGKGKKGKAYKGAEIFTNTAYQYGKVEFRMMAAKGSGILSNFFTWKDGSEQSNVFWEEIDFEVFGKNNAQSWQSNIISGFDPRTTSEQVHTASTSFGDYYHTYTLEWTPNEIVWYVDGVETRKTTGGQASLLTAQHQLRFNFWAADIPTWVGVFDDSILPVHMYVSWIKYYSYSNGNFVLDWEDSFGSFDGNRWGTANWTFAENLVDFDPTNVTTDNGKLVLSMTNSGQTGFSGTAPVDSLDDNNGGGNNGGGNGTAPTAPPDITVNGTDACSVDLSWLPSTDDVAVISYNVFVDGVLTLNTAQTSAVVTGLNANTNYQFEVSALDGDGNESPRTEQYTRTKKKGCSANRHAGVALSATNALTIYPNPATKKVFVEIDESIQSMTMMNHLGQNIHIAFQQTSRGWVADLNQVNPGFYVVRAFDGQNVWIGKLQVE